MQKKKIKKYQFGNNPCGEGTVWDEVKKQCVPVIEKNITQQDLLWGNLISSNGTPTINETLYPVYTSGGVSPSALKSAGTDATGEVIKSDVVYPKGVGVKDGRGRFIPQNMVIGEALDQGFNLDSDNVYRKKEITEDKNKLWYSPTFQALNAAMDITRLIANPINDAKNSEEERKKLLKARYMQSNYNPYETGLNNVPVYMQNGGSFGNAFSSARAKGLKIFTWKGKKYTTQLAEDIPVKEQAKNKEVVTKKVASPTKPVRKSAQTVKKPETSKTFAESIRPNMAMPAKKAALESGVVVDKRTNEAYVIKNGKVDRSFPVLTGKNPELNSNEYSIAELNANPNLRNTPIGGYQMNMSQGNIYGSPGYNLNPLGFPGFGVPQASGLAMHNTYDPAVRNKYYTQSAQNRNQSYGCINCRPKDLNKIKQDFPQGDTLLVIDSKKGQTLKSLGIKQNGGNINNTGYTPGTSTFNNPYNVIPSGNITMKNTPFPIMAYPNVGSPKMLYPGGKYNFPKATSVLEIPSMQIGGDAYNGYSEQPAPQEQSIAKIPDQAPAHEDGGVNVNNVAELEQGEVYTEDASGNPVRVLEDTSDKRADNKSKSLKITPEEAEQLVNFKPKRSITHSRLFEEASKYYDKKFKSLEKKVGKNLEYIRLKNGGSYAQNAFEENLKILKQLPTSQQIFDVIYGHQQEAKRKYNIENKDEMKYGGLPKYQNGTAKYIGPNGEVIQVGDKVYDDDSVLTQYAVNEYLKNGVIKPYNNTSGYVDKLNPSTYSFNDKLQFFNSQDTTTGYQPFISGTDRAGTVSEYNPEHVAWNSYYFNKPITASTFQKNVQTALKPILGYNYDFNAGDKTIDNVYGNVTYNTPLPKATVSGKKSGVISLQDYINTKDKSKLANEYGISVEQLNSVFSKDNKQYNNQLVVYTENADDEPKAEHNSSVTQREQNINGEKTAKDTIPNVNDKYSKPNEVTPSTVSSHLGLSGGLGNILGYIDTGRTPVDLEQLDFRPIRARELNPLPTLLENRNDYNAALNMLPQSGAGYANQTNLQAQRYKFNNQVMGQYENMNKQRLDAVDAANTQAQMSVDQANMAIRDTFNTRVLTSKEKQRQQKAEYLNGLFKAIDERNAFDRNANLALKLSPFFNEKGEFNHNKYTLSIPTNMAGSENSVQYITDKQTGQKFRIIMDSNGKLISSSNVIGDNKAAEKTPSIK